MEPTLRARSDLPVRACAEGARDLLWAGTPREVLARIVPEDPLGLRALVGARLRERALLCDAERVLLIAQVQCALQAVHWRGQPELSSWLLERVEEALALTLAEDWTSFELPFAVPLAVDPRRLAVACWRFNRLPFEQREAFFVLVLDSTGADRAARARGLSLSELARRARAALQLFFQASSPVSPSPASAMAS